MEKKSKRRQRIARNFIRSYGKLKFKRLLDALRNGESGQIIANEFKVSRERVRQWKNIFGQIVTYYRVYPDIEPTVLGAE
ncbi:MAG: hypothetical protein VX278_22820 [Myxococcota bacterium]|nr:hypothetical protein [Myxococcota bacterium]